MSSVTVFLFLQSVCHSFSTTVTLSKKGSAWANTREVSFAEDRKIGEKKRLDLDSSVALARRK